MILNEEFGNIFVGYPIQFGVHNIQLKLKIKMNLQKIINKKL